MNINEYIEKHANFREAGGWEIKGTTPRVVCADGFSMSVQASEYSYCSPRGNRAHNYYEMEIGFPSEMEPDIMEWAEDASCPTQTVYGYVPVEVIDAVIKKHGGFKED